MRLARGVNTVSNDDLNSETQESHQMPYSDFWKSGRIAGIEFLMTIEHKTGSALRSVDSWPTWHWRKRSADMKPPRSGEQ